MAKKSRGLSPEQLLTQVKRGDIEPFYLLHGDEEYEREAVASILIETLAPVQARDFNLDIIRAEGFELLDFLQLYQAYPMMAETRLVVLRDVQTLSADQCRSLEKILNSPAATTRLLVVGKKVDMRRKFFREIGRHGKVVEFRPPYDNQVPQWIQRYAKRRGFEIEQEAIEILSQYVGAKPRELVSELEKLVSFAGLPITATAVEQVTGITRGASVFDLADAIGKGQGDRAQELLRQFLEQGEEPTRAVAMIARHFQILLKARSLMGKSIAREEMASKLGVAPFFLSSYMDQAKSRSTAWYWTGLAALKEADWRLKSQGRRQEAAVLDLLIARLCGVAQRG